MEEKKYRVELAGGVPYLEQNATDMHLSTNGDLIFHKRPSEYADAEIVFIVAAMHWTVAYPLENDE